MLRISSVSVGSSPNLSELGYPSVKMEKGASLLSELLRAFHQLLSDLHVMLTFPPLGNKQDTLRLPHVTDFWVWLPALMNVPWDVKALQITGAKDETDTDGYILFP